MFNQPLTSWLVGLVRSKRHGRTEEMRSSNTLRRSAILWPPKWRRARSRAMPQLRKHAQRLLISSGTRSSQINPRYSGDCWVFSPLYIYIYIYIYLIYIYIDILGILMDYLDSWNFPIIQAVQWNKMWGFEHCSTGQTEMPFNQLMVLCVFVCPFHIILLAIDWRF